MKIGFVVCSRIESSRVPKKAFINYNGKPHIEHLIERLLKTDIPVYIAVPESDAVHYNYLLDKYPKRVFLSAGFDNDPLRRMYGVAKQNGLDSVIRVTHDKILVDDAMVFRAVDEFRKKGLDYLFSSTFLPGTAFEIISFAALEKAAKSFRRVEHISYAIKAITENKLDLKLNELEKNYRFLVDYPEDVELFHVLFASLGSEFNLTQAVEFLDAHPWVAHINRLPLVTVYTCAYNAEKWIEECMGSVAKQENFRNFEYILVDDASNDKTPYLMAKFAQVFKNSSWYRNQTNLGLATSSNIALKKAKGKFIVRLDADDFFSSNDAIQTMVEEMEDRGLDAIYPNNYLGLSRKQVQRGNEHHHIGGTLFKTSAINHVKFTDGLRNFDSLDLFARAKDQIKVGYISKPLFVYRQHDGSMSKTNLEDRLLQKRIINEQCEKEISGN